MGLRKPTSNPWPPPEAVTTLRQGEAAAYWSLVRAGIPTGALLTKGAATIGLLSWRQWGEVTSCWLNQIGGWRAKPSGVFRVSLPGPGTGQRNERNGSR